MTHAGCGGEIVEDWGKLYEYESDDGRASLMPALRCKRCNKEIIGDSEIWLGDEDEC